MTATLSPPETAFTTDRVGAVENAGVEYLSEDARDSRPRNLGTVFLGANLTWTNVVFGAFAILFGLSFWQTVTSMAVGIAVGTLAVVPTAIIGPRTGTNMTVSSGAFFGIRGRFIGSGIALLIAFGFAAVTVWTSGDAIVAAGYRLLGTPENDAVLLLWDCEARLRPSIDILQTQVGGRAYSEKCRERTFLRTAASRQQRSPNFRLGSRRPSKSITAKAPFRRFRRFSEVFG